MVNYTIKRLKCLKIDSSALQLILFIISTVMKPILDLIPQDRGVHFDYCKDRNLLNRFFGRVYILNNTNLWASKYWYETTEIWVLQNQLIRKLMAENYATKPILDWLYIKLSNGTIQFWTVQFCAVL